MSEPHYVSFYRVTEKMVGVHPEQPDYPLLPGDVLTQDKGGTWTKHGPGLGIVGFTLSVEQQETLLPLVRPPAMRIVGMAEYIARLADLPASGRDPGVAVPAAGDTT